MNLTFEEEYLLNEYLKLGLTKEEIINQLTNTKSEYEEAKIIATSLLRKLKDNVS